MSLLGRGARAAAIALLRLRAAVQPRSVSQPSTTDTERSAETTAIDPDGPWLDPERPRVAYIFRLPFDLSVDTRALGIRILIPLEDEQAPACVNVARVPAPRLLNDAPLRYLCRIRGQEAPESQPELADDWVAEVELNNALVEGRSGWSPGELLFERALDTFNRYLHAYMVACESSSVRFLTAQALDPLAIVEFRLADGTPLDAGAFILPAAHRTSNSLNPSVVNSRLKHAVRAEGHGHPVDDVILWRVRAEHLLNYVGDYELSLLALQTSVERLVYALASAVAVDKGASKEAVKQVQEKHFGPLTKTLQHDLGGSWDKNRLDQPFGAYWQHLYLVRNQVGHAGRRIDFHVAERAFQGYRDFKEFIEDRVLRKANVFSRTAMMLFGLQDLVARGGGTRAVLDLDRQLQRSGEEYGWWEPSG